MANIFKKAARKIKGHKSHSDSIDKRMNDIRTFMLSTARDIAADPNTDMETYIRKVRVPLNTMLIEISMGLTLKAKEKKSGIKSSFHFGPKPDLETISELGAALDYFIETVERPFYDQFSNTFDPDDDYDDDDDMSLDDDIDDFDDIDGDINGSVNDISYIKEILIPEKDNNVLKLSKKKVLKLYKNRLSKGTIKPSHLIQLYNAGRVLRKRRKIKITVISAAAVAAIVGAAIFVGYKCSSKDEPEMIDEINPDDIDDIDVDDIDVDIDVDIDDDVPQVEIDDGDIAV